MKKPYKLAALLLVGLALTAAGCEGDTLSEACKQHGGEPRGGYQLVQENHRHDGDDADEVQTEALCADGGKAEIDIVNATPRSTGWVVE